MNFMKEWDTAGRLGLDHYPWRFHPWRFHPWFHHRLRSTVSEAVARATTWRRYA